MTAAGATVVRRLRSITLALAAGVMLFGVVAAGVVLSGGGPRVELGTAVRLGAAVLGIVLIGSAQVVGPLLSRTRPGADPAEAEQGILNGCLVGMALRESAGILGGVVGLLTGDLLLMGALVAASVVTMLVGIPPRDEIERRLRR